jgi:hypothetical protein
MWEKNITSQSAGTYRSLNGAADENIFIGKATKAGFFLFFKAWRDMPYDAVLDHMGILFRVEVKGASVNKQGKTQFNVTRGGRSGKQIDKSAPSRTRLIERADCDFVVGVNSDNGDCYIIPTDFIEIVGHQNLTTKTVEVFKEQWKLFTFGPGRLDGEATRDGLRKKALSDLQSIGRSLGVSAPAAVYKVAGTNLKITAEEDKWILSIWEKLCS